MARNDVPLKHEATSTLNSTRSFQTLNEAGQCSTACFNALTPLEAHGCSGRVSFTTQNNDIPIAKSVKVGAKGSPAYQLAPIDLLRTQLD